MDKNKLAAAVAQELLSAVQNAINIAGQAPAELNYDNREYYFIVEEAKENDTLNVGVYLHSPNEDEDPDAPTVTVQIGIKKIF